MFDGIKANMVGAFSGERVPASANTFVGFRASAVDLGALQTLFERGLVAFDTNLVRERWNDDVFVWIANVIRTWVQRCKSMHFDLTEEGIRIRLETQDDLGYYNYEFDVFPGRKG